MLYAAMDYLTSEDVETYLQVDFTDDQEAAVEALIEAIGPLVEKETNRKWGGSGSQTETFDGGVGVFFPTYPVSAITSITIDGSPVDSSNIYNYGSYIRLGYAANSGFRNVVIVYTPVDEDMPADLKQALIQWVAQLYNTSTDAGKDIKRVTVGPITTEYVVKDGLPDFVQSAIDRYRVPVV